MASTRRRTVTTADGVALHITEAGDPAAPPLVLVHGFACSSRYWRHQLADPVLTERFRVIAPDLRGHGASQKRLSDAQLATQRPADLVTKPEFRSVLQSPEFRSTSAGELFARPKNVEALTRILRESGAAGTARP